jgi:hypothetical protein
MPFNRSIGLEMSKASQAIENLLNRSMQATVLFQRTLQQEQHNVMLLEQLAEREREAAQIAQTNLQESQIFMQEMKQILQACRTTEQLVRNVEQQMFTDNTSQMMYQQQPQGFRQ